MYCFRSHQTRVILRLSHHFLFYFYISAKGLLCVCRSYKLLGMRRKHRSLQSVSSSCRPIAISWSMSISCELRKSRNILVLLWIVRLLNLRAHFNKSTSRSFLIVIMAISLQRSFLAATTRRKSRLTILWIFNILASLFKNLKSLNIQLMIWLDYAICICANPIVLRSPIINIYIECQSLCSTISIVVNDWVGILQIGLRWSAS